MSLEQYYITMWGIQYHKPTEMLCIYWMWPKSKPQDPPPQPQKNPKKQKKVLTLALNNAIIFLSLRPYINRLTVWLTIKRLYLFSMKVSKGNTHPPLAENTSACLKQQDTAMLIILSHRSTVRVITSDLFWPHSHCLHGICLGWLIPSLSRRTVDFTLSRPPLQLKPQQQNPVERGMPPCLCNIWKMHRAPLCSCWTGFLKRDWLCREVFTLWQLPGTRWLGGSAQKRPQWYVLTT